MKTIKLPYPVSFQELLEISVKTKPAARIKKKNQSAKREPKRASKLTN